MLVRAGGGNDTVTVEPGTRVRVTLLGGDGDDRLAGGDGDDVILGGWGRDTSGRRRRGRTGSSAGRTTTTSTARPGDDRLAGGDGDDTLYGLDGADRMAGDAGRDYLDGGAGADAVDGGDDADVLVGGRDSDRLVGGAGADALYGGAGADRLHGGGRRPGAGPVVRPDRRRWSPASAGQVTVELTDVGGFIRVEGTPEFVARVQSDLDALRASPRGAQMLAALQASHEQLRPVAPDLPLVGGLLHDRNTLVIRETTVPNGFAQPRRPADRPGRRA